MNDNPTPYLCDQTEQQLELLPVLDVRSLRSVGDLEDELEFIGLCVENVARDAELIGHWRAFSLDAFNLSRQIVDMREGRA